MSVSVFLKDASPSIGEGPLWEERSQSLLYVDIANGEVHRYNTVTRNNSEIKLGGEVGFVVSRKAGGYLVGVNNTITYLDWENMTAKPMAEVEQGRGTRFNDAKCDPAGRLWAGTMGVEKSHGDLEYGLGSLYSLDKNQDLTNRFSPVSISNGLAWSNDKRTMFYIDTVPRQVFAFDYNVTSGDIDNKRVVFDYNKISQQDIGSPDGMCIDQEDKLWVACFNGGRVIRIDPEVGTILQEVHFPALKTTSCCFGGQNYDELYVTCSQWKISPEERAKYPLAGSIFKVTGLGVKGSPPVDYDG